MTHRQREIKCKRCKHIWTYKGYKLNKNVKYRNYVNCPMCRTSVKLEVKE